MSATVISLTQNLAILLALVFLYGFFAPKRHHLSPRISSAIMGVLFGLFGVASMITPVLLPVGLLLDLRMAPLAIAGAFGGWISGLLAAIPVVVYRLSLSQAGIGTLPAAITPFILALVMGWWHKRRFSQLKSNDFELMLIGLSAAGISISSLLLLPVEQIGESIIELGPPLLIALPITTLLLGKLLTFQDERLELTQKLQESERRLKAIFNNSFQFIGLLLPDGTLIEANETALTFAGLTSVDAIGKPFWEVRWWTLTPETQSRLRNAINRAARGEFIRYEEDIRGIGDRVVTIDFSLKPMVDENGKIVLLIPEGRDITDTKLAEERLIQLEIEREKNAITKRFIADAWHDLRTPITILKSSGYLLGKHHDILTAQINELYTQIESDKVSTAATTIMEDITTTLSKMHERRKTTQVQVDHLQKLIENLLELASMDNSGAFEFMSRDVSRVVKEVVEIYQPLAFEQHISLHYDPQTAPMPLMMDEVRFRSMISNLLENALQYTRKDGSISVKTYCTKDHVIVEVRDNGIGMSAKDLPRIFERFYRSDTARVLRENGTGLGLAIVKRVVDAHEGRIEVESEPEAGTLFRLFFPLSGGRSHMHIVSRRYRKVG